MAETGRTSGDDDENERGADGDILRSPQASPAEVFGRRTASHRDAKRERLIQGPGRVEVNWKRSGDGARRRVEPERDQVRVDGRASARRARAYYLLNKPQGTITSASDPEGGRRGELLLRGWCRERVFPRDAWTGARGLLILPMTETGRTA